MNKKEEIINYLRSYAQPPQMMKVFPDFEIIKEAVSMLEQQEALSKPLADAARRYAIPAYMKDVDENFLNEYPYDRVAEKAFIAGAKWQQEQDTRDMVMSDNRHFVKVYELGKKDMKEQMLKEAVEGEYDSYPAAIYLETPVQGIEHGDKVRIIIVKED